MIKTKDIRPKLKNKKVKKLDSFKRPQNLKPKNIIYFNYFFF